MAASSTRRPRRRGGDQTRPTRGRGATPPRRASGGRSAAKSTAGSKGSGSGSGGDRSRPPNRVVAAFREHLGERRRDVAGIALVLLGVLAGLGIYAGAAGPVGDFLEAVTLGLFGLVGYLAPVLLVWFGGLAVAARSETEIGRIAVGVVILGLGVLAGLHLVAGAPQPADGIRPLWTAGGLVGWGLATPLVWAASVWGAGAVVAGLIVLGALVVTKTPFSAVVSSLRNAFTSDPDDARGDVDQARAELQRRAAEAAADPPRSRATLANTAEELPVDGPPADDAEPTAEVTRAITASGDQGAPAATAATPRAVRSASGKAAKVRPVQNWDDYQLPPLSMLAGGRSLEKESARTIEAQTTALQETFHQFGVDATVARWSRGPTVTRFEIELGPGVQVKKVANMGDDIAYALAAPDVRIVAPIPGKSAIGVEVPNRQRDLVTLGDILRSEEARSDPHPLTVAMGVDIAGNPAIVNLATMPHLLVSGATGSGKSVTLNGMIHSIIMRARPDEVRMILIDPKRVELNAYQGAPHLLSPVVTDPRRAADAVQWCVKEMEQRYELLAHLGYRNIDGYNEAVAAGEVATRPGPPDEDGLPTELEARPLPYILLVIDELADLMLVAPRDVEDAICRIAQMARAVGIHMIIATQRPSVDVITGLIKANIPSRLALQVASQTDSRTIIDMNGAEKLVGKGDMLFLPASQGKPTRLQGCWVTEREINTAVAFCKGQRQAEYDDRVVKEGEAADQADAERSGDDGSDAALLRRAAEQVVVSGLGSTSMLQRKLRIGFARAGRLMDELEELGVVGPNEGSKAREVLWSPEELDEARSHNVL